MDAGRSTRRAVTCVILGALALVLVTVGSGPAAAAKGQKLGLALCAPDENTFTLGINNAYFPLLTGFLAQTLAEVERTPAASGDPEPALAAKTSAADE